MFKTTWQLLYQSPDLECLSLPQTKLRFTGWSRPSHCQMFRTYFKLPQPLHSFVIWPFIPQKCNCRRFINLSFCHYQLVEGSEHDSAGVTQQIFIKMCYLPFSYDIVSKPNWELLLGYFLIALVKSFYSFIISSNINFTLKKGSNISFSFNVKLLSSMHTFNN